MIGFAAHRLMELEVETLAGAVEIDHHAHQADQIAQGRCVLPARDGRLRTQIPAGIG